MLYIHSASVRIVLAMSLIAGIQGILPVGAKGQSSGSERSIGVPRYVEPPTARFRIVFGYGANAGLGLLTPSTIIGNASYQTGLSTISAGFVSSRSVTADLPYRTYSEFDLMYGIAFESAMPHYKDPSDNFHVSLSTGISIDSYSERWRPYGRRPLPFNLYPPTTYQYSVGLPIQLQAIYEPLRIFGIGLGLGALVFYNISSFTPSYGAAVVAEARY